MTRPESESTFASVRDTVDLAAAFETTFASVRDTVELEAAVVGIGLATLAVVRDEIVDVPVLDIPYRDDDRDRRR